MNNLNSPHLFLASRTVSREDGSTKEDSRSNLEGEQAALSLLEAKDSAPESLSKIVEYISKINKIQTHGTIVQLSHDVVVNLFDNEGNGTVSFHFDLANYGIQTLASRVHRFWFINPQSSLKIEAFDEDDQKLDVEDLVLAPTRREVKIHFTRPLEASDRFRYRVQFEVENGFAGNYYDITARTITRQISFTLLSPPGSRFDTKKVTQESADGFTSDTPPLISLSLEEDREKLFWQHRKPKPGDQFRTSWSFRERE